MISSMNISNQYLISQKIKVFHKEKVEDFREESLSNNSYFDLMGSLILEKEGKYEIFKIPVHFKESSADSKYGILENMLSKVFFKTLHVFIHEMGHALAYKAVGMKSKVVIYYGVGGATISVRPLLDLKKKSLEKEKYDIFGWPLTEIEADSIVTAAGPLGSAAFSCSQIITAEILKSYNIIPFSVITIIKIISIFNLIYELSYATESSLARSDGDFGLLLKNNEKHHLMASVALFAISFFGLLAARDAIKTVFISFCSFLDTLDSEFSLR